MAWVGVLLVTSFAGLLTTHIALAVGLLRRTPRWRGLVVLLVPLFPLAVYWALEEKMYIRSALWVTNLVVYVVALVLAHI